MTRIRRLVTGLAALLAVAALVAGPPWALLRYLGDPLPQHLPGWAQLRTGLAGHQIPDQVLLDVLALAVWAGWALLVASLTVETVAAVRGRTAPRLPAAGPLQPLAAVLVTTILAAALGALSRPPAATAAAPLAAALAGSPLAATLVVPAAQPFATVPFTGMPSPAVASASNGHDHPARTGTTATPRTAWQARRYVVQRRDTLWGIADNQLGDPYRWTEIWQLNRGRLMPDGCTFTDPNRIWPGWTLQLPAGAATSARDTKPTIGPPSHRDNQHDAAPAASPAPAPSESPPTTPRTAVPTTVPTQAPRSIPSAPAAAHQRQDDDRAALQAEALLGLSLAAGISTAVLTARRRRRRRYRPSEPTPGLDGTDPLASPLVTRLRRYQIATAAPPDTGDGQGPLGRPLEAAAGAPAASVASAEVGLGVLTVASDRNAEPVRLDLPDLGGLVLTGAGALPAVRALALAWLTQAAADRSEVVVADPALAADIAGELPLLPTVTVAHGTTAALTHTEQELLTRTRLLDAADADDFTTFIAAYPGEPLPALLLLTRGEFADQQHRWAAVLAAGRRVGIAGVHLDDRTGRPGAVDVAADGHAASVPTGGPLTVLADARLAVLDAAEADELTRLLLAARLDDPDPVPSPPHAGDATPATPDEPQRITATPADAPGSDWPAAPPDRPVDVRVFGPPRILADNDELDTGLRSKARELAVFLLLHPAGATDDTVIDALWPDAPPGRGIEYFRTALGNLRKTLRTVTGRTDATFVDRTAGRYRLDPDLLDADLWRFQAALTDARHAADDHTLRRALERAAAAYTGDLAADTPYAWAEPYREDLRRRALDALTRLADLHHAAREPDQAIGALDQAIGHDPYAEELYRRVIRIQLAQHRPDAARRSYRQLETRLAELDVDPDPATTALLTTHDRRTGMSERAVPARDGLERRSS